MPRHAKPPRDDALVSWLHDARRLLRQHRDRIGARANPLLPRSFNEHVLHRLLFARRPQHRTMNDKHAMRAFVEQRVGAGHTVPLLHATCDPADLPWERLPRSIMLKASHGCGWVRAVADHAAADRGALAAEAAGWLQRCYYRESREWGYRGIVPRLLVEPLLAALPGEAAPRDYKLFVFHGRVACVMVRRVGEDGQITTAVHDASGERLPLRYNGRGDGHPTPPASSALLQFAALAARIGAGIDFLRLDGFHDPVADRVLVNELTPYPNAGAGPFEPRAADAWLGACWRAAARGAPFPRPAF